MTVLFLISKLVEFLLLPSNLIGFLGLLGVFAWLIRWRTIGAACLVAASLLLALSGWSPIGLAAVKALEDRFPQPVISGPVTGIIMLGGAVDTHITRYRGSTALNEGGERLTTTLDLSRQYPEARIFLSGGANHPSADGSLTESRVARDLLIRLGLPADRIEMEERSRTTCENATESTVALKPDPDQQWLLVTSASHMPRAVACFRAAGFKVVPFPVDYRTRGSDELARPVPSIALGLEATDLAAHEWLGLATYRATGLTNEVFPAP
jgi:uncharacterized SAM-binding protein YcdF (DUF218 family)